MKIHVGVLLDGFKASEHPRGHCGTHARSIYSCAFECQASFTARRGTAPTGYPCTQELKSAAPSVSMKGITLYQPRIVHARFMIEISWKESSVFWKWFRYYIFPLWREEISSFLVISSWAWHRKRVSTPISQGSLFLMGRTAKYFWPIKVVLKYFEI